MGGLRIVDVGDAEKLIGHDKDGNFILAVSTPEGISGGYTPPNGIYVEFSRDSETPQDDGEIDPVLSFARSAFLNRTF